MISVNYLVYLVRRHRVLLAVSFVLLAAFQVLIVALVEEVDLPAFVQGLMRQLPPLAQQLVGEEFMAQFSVSGAVAFGYNHPFVLVLLSLPAILLPAGHVAGEVEGGTLELLFSLPVRRPAVACTLWLGTGLALAVLVLGCALGTEAGLLLYPGVAGAVEAAALARVGFNLWLLVFTVGSYALLFSVFARERSQAGLRAAGLTLFFYFLSFAVRIWPPLEGLAPCTLFHYYRPQQLMTGTAGWGRDVVVLVVVLLAAGGAAVLRLGRRDIP